MCRNILLDWWHFKYPLFKIFMPGNDKTISIASCHMSVFEKKGMFHLCFIHWHFRMWKSLIVNLAEYVFTKISIESWTGLLINFSIVSIVISLSTSSYMYSLSNSLPNYVGNRIFKPYKGDNNFTFLKDIFIPNQPQLALWLR